MSQLKVTTRSNVAKTDGGAEVVSMMDLNVQLKLLNEKYADVVERLDNLSSLCNKMSVLEERVESLMIENTEKTQTILNLQTRLAKIEQYSRRDAIEIRDVPVTDNESSEAITLEIAKKLQIDVGPSDISVAHRLPARRGQVPAIIVKFCSRKKRDAFLEKKRMIILKSDLVKGNHGGRIYIGDSLSPYYKNLMWKAKQIANDNDFKFVWWRNEICVRKKEGSSVIKIRNENDLKLII